MAGIVSAASTVAQILAAVGDKDLSAKTILDAVGSNKVKLTSVDGSMMKLLGKYIVEPVAVVSSDLRQDEITDKLLGLHTDIFTSTYLQIFDVLRNLYGLDTNMVIDALSTDNGGLTRMFMAGAKYAIESDDVDYFGDLANDIISLGLESEFTAGNNRKKRGKVEVTSANGRRVDGNGMGASRTTSSRSGSGYSPTKGDVFTGRSTRLERMQADTDNENRRYEHDKELINQKFGNELYLKNEEEKRRSRFGGRLAANRDFKVEKSSLSDINKELVIPNAIQRTIDVTLETTLKDPRTGKSAKSEDGIQHTLTVTIPITIKLHVIYTPIDNILGTVEHMSNDANFYNRFDEYRSGAISLADLILAGDLIKKYKKNRLRDRSGLMSMLNERKLSANSKTVDNMFPGFEKYYTMYMITNEDKARLEKVLRGRLSNDRIKNKFLESAGGLSISVVDQDYERVSIRMKDLRGSSDLTYRSIIKADRKGTDMTEMITALMANKPPVF